MEPLYHIFLYICADNNTKMNYLTRLLLITAITSATTLKATAQIDSLIYNTDNPTIVADERYELRINVDGMAFFRDNEYNTKDAVKGYTLPGVWLQPSVSYQPCATSNWSWGPT